MTINGKLFAGGLAAVGALVAFCFAASTCTGCGPTAQPSQLPSDVVNLDIALCQIDHDLGGPSIPLLCPFGRITMPRAQYLAAKAASFDGGGQ